MQEKIIGVAAILALVVGFSFVQNFWEKQRVLDSTREILNPNNAHTFKDRPGLEEALYQAAHGIVGDKGDPAIELYHFQGIAYTSEVDMDKLPKYGGVKVQGEQVQISALVGRIWWYQYTMWNKSWRNDVQVTKAVFIDADKLGYTYESPSKSEFDFVENPALLLDVSK